MAVQERKPTEIKLGSDGEVVLDYVVESNAIPALRNGGYNDTFDNFNGKKVDNETIIKSVLFGAALFFVGKMAWFYLKKK